VLATASRGVSIQIAYVLGLPPPGVNPDTTLLSVDWRLLSKWSLESTIGGARTTIRPALADSLLISSRSSRKVQHVDADGPRQPQCVRALDDAAAKDEHRIATMTQYWSIRGRRTFRGESLRPSVMARATGAAEQETPLDAPPDRGFLVASEIHAA